MSEMILTAEQTGGQPIYRIDDGLYAMPFEQAVPSTPYMFDIQWLQERLAPYGVSIGETVQEHASAILLAICAGIITFVHTRYVPPVPPKRLLCSACEKMARWFVWYKGFSSPTQPPFPPCIIAYRVMCDDHMTHDALYGRDGYQVERIQLVPDQFLPDGDRAKSNGPG